MSLLMNKQGYGKRKRRNLKQTAAYASKEAEEAAKELSAAITATSLVAAFYVTSIIAYSYNYQQSWSVKEAVYFATVTMTSVGFGDFSPTQRDSKDFTVFFAIAGVCVIAVGLQQIATFLERRREVFVAATKKRLIQAAASPAAKKSMKEQEKTDVVSPSKVNHQHHHHHTHSITNRMGSSLGHIHSSVNTFEALESQTGAQVTNPNDPRWLVIVRSYYPLMMVIVRLTVYLFATGLLYSFLEDWTIIDGLYYAVITGCTVGYGELTPRSSLGMWLTNLWLPASVIFVGSELSKLASLVFDSNAEDASLASLMNADLSLEALLKMDADGDGEITEYEFLKFMLTKAELAEADVLEAIHKQFCKLDADGSGFLSRDDLEEFTGINEEPLGSDIIAKNEAFSRTRQLKVLLKSLPSRKIRLLESITQQSMEGSKQTEGFEEGSGMPLLERQSLVIDEPCLHDDFDDMVLKGVRGGVASQEEANEKEEESSSKNEFTVGDGSSQRTSQSFPRQNSRYHSRGKGKGNSGRIRVEGKGSKTGKGRGRSRGGASLKSQFSLDDSASDSLNRRTEFSSSIRSKHSMDFDAQSSDNQDAYPLIPSDTKMISLPLAPKKAGKQSPPRSKYVDSNLYDPSSEIVL